MTGIAENRRHKLRRLRLLRAQIAIVKLRSVRRAVEAAACARSLNLTASNLRVLTERERSVLRLLANRMSDRAIGRALHLTERTVKGDVSKVPAKLKLEDRTQAALLALRLGMNGEEE